MPYIQNATSFLIQFIFGFVLFIVLLRFWMQWVRADFRNQVGQFVIAITNPLVIPLRKVLPSTGSIDTATVLLAYVIALLEIVALLLVEGHSVSLVGYLIGAAGNLIEATIYLFMICIFVRIVASWISPGSYHPVVMIAHSISEPLMAPARRIIPPIGGFDLSAILVILFLQLSLILVVAPIMALVK